MPSLHTRRFVATNKVDNIKLACTHFFVSEQSKQQQSSQQQQQNFAANVVLFVHQWGKMGGCASLLSGIASKMVIMMYTRVEVAGTVPRDGGRFDAVTFNLRGVGDSTGDATFTCVDEIRDVHAVAHHLVSNEGVKRIWLVGSSAGACIAGSALHNCPAVQAAGLIAYPYGRLASLAFRSHFMFVKLSAVPKLFVEGSDDGFTSSSQMDELQRSCCGPINEKIVIPGGHFEIEGSEHDEAMARRFCDFFSRIHIDNLKRQQQQEPTGSIAALSSSSSLGAVQSSSLAK